MILYLSTSYSGHRARSRPIHWLYLGHICSQLREILLAMRQLWAGVAFALHRLDATREIVFRAARAPLTITLCSGGLDPESDESIDHLLSCLPHGRHIEIESSRILLRILDQLPVIQLPLAEKIIFKNTFPTRSSHQFNPQTLTDNEEVSRRSREILQRRFKELHATDLERLRTVACRTLLIGTKVTCVSQS